MGKVIYKCPLCENDVSETDLVCPHCGAEFEPLNENKTEEVRLMKETKQEVKQEEVKQEVKPVTAENETVEKVEEKPTEAQRSVKKTGKKSEYFQKILEIQKEKLSIKDVVDVLGKSGVYCRALLEELVTTGKLKKVKENRKNFYVKG